MFVNFRVGLYMDALYLGEGAYVWDKYFHLEFFKTNICVSIQKWKEIQAGDKSLLSWYFIIWKKQNTLLNQVHFARSFMFDKVSFCVY